MSLKNNIKQQGFTIVELLIVIVVIGILAAITIVAYNGVQNRAKASSAQAAANAVVKKAELYNSENASYPDAITDLTTGQSGKTWELIGATVSGYTLSSAPSTASTLGFRACLAGSTPTNQAAIISGATATGVIVTYWNWSASTPAAATVTAGNIGNGTTACPTT